MKQQSNKHRRIFLPDSERGGPPSQSNQPTLLSYKNSVSLIYPALMSFLPKITMRMLTVSMKNINLNLIILIALVIFLGCKTKKNVENDFPIKFIESFDRKLEVTQIFDTTSFIYIPLETNKNCLIGEIHKVLIHDEFIFVLDSRYVNSLYIFHKDGKFIRRIGKEGYGPGEYLRISDFDIDPIKNNIIVYDLHNQKLLFFDFNGVHLREESLVKYCGMTFVHLSDNYFAFYLHRRMENINSQLLIYHNQKVNEMKQFSIREVSESQLMPDYFSRNDTNIYFIPLHYDEIYKISNKGKITKVYDFNLESLMGNDSLNKENKIKYNQLGNFKSLSVNNLKQFYCCTSYNERVIFIFGNLSNSTFLYGTHFSKFNKTPEEIIGTYKDYFIAIFYPYVSNLKYKFPDAKQDDNPGILLFKMKI